MPVAAQTSLTGENLASRTPDRERDEMFQGVGLLAGLPLVCTGHPCVRLSILSSSSFPSPDVLASVNGTTLVARVLFWPLHYLLIVKPHLYPLCHYSGLHFCLFPPGSLVPFQLVSKCLYATLASFTHCFHTNLHVTILFQNCHQLLIVY